MTSSILTGERRWASGRRTGMTVLGKVAVPKPINLPSQRLENHGLDPNVEIVPKGTLSWGSRSSSSASNPWSSLSQSPNTDSTTSHLSGRPSSGGSGTRPSTAGSDRAHESTASAWGPNSRPSSASGAAGSNQASLALLRPRSAETRPSSSNLSRFAEASSENPIAWSSAATAEKLGVVQYKHEGFALTSGDFPVLGSDKGNGGKKCESQDDVSHNENVKIASVNSWNRDNPPYSEDGATRYGTEKWQGHPHPYTGANMVSPPYDTWNCIPANNPQGGVCYRGPTLYGTPAPPAGFPMEPFPYHHPHISVGPLANQQPVHPTGVGPRGHHPQTNFCRHPVPDSFVRPAMPMRPGFFPGPVPYEGYYGPPRGYINERGVACPGTLGASSFYDRYPSQNAPDFNSQLRSSECGSTGQGLVSVKGNSSHSHDSKRSLKVPTNQHNCWDDEIVGQNGDSFFEINQPPHAIIDQQRTSSHAEMVDEQRNSLQEKLRLDDVNDGKPDLRRRPLAIEASFNTSGHQGTHASDPIKLSSSHGNVDKSEAVGDISLHKLELPVIGYSEVLPILPAAAKDSILIQKIEDLNVKGRDCDGRHDCAPIYGMEEEGNIIRVKSVKTSPSENEDCGPVYSERPPVDGDMNAAPNEISLLSIDKSNGRGAISLYRRNTREMQSRVSHRERKFFTHDVDERRKGSPADSQGMVMASHPETSNAHFEHLSATEESDSFPLERHEGESVQPVLDLNVDHAQRAKMREVAKQRTKQLQEEEKERTRKQKAKAWAKLEELNRRTQAEAEPTQNYDNSPSDVIKDKQDVIKEEERTMKQKAKTPAKLEELNRHTQAEAEPTQNYDNSPSDVIKDQQEENMTFGAIRLSDYLSGKYGRVASPQTVAHKIEKSTIQNELHVLSTEKVEGGLEELVEQNQFVSLNHANDLPTAHKDTVTQIHDGNFSNLKHMGCKDKQSVQSAKKSTEKSTFDNVHEAQSILTQVADISASPSESNLPVTVNSKFSTHPRKKNNKSGKSKNKVGDGSPYAIPTSLSEEKTLTKSGKPISEPEAISTSVHPLATSEDANHSSDHFSSPIEDSQEKGNGQGKSQHSRRISKNLQGRSSEKFHGRDAVIWAPVRSLNKSEAIDEANQKTEVQTSSSTIKADHVQSNSKNKRAEMERYIPKPVAREMAQQGSIQQLEVSSKNQTTLDDNRSHSNSTVTGRSTGSTAGNVGSALESRIGDARQYKQSKSHRLWQQRVDTKWKNGQQDQSALKSEQPQQLQKAHESYADEWNPPDGWNMPNSESVAPVTSHGARDQGNTGRGKQHQFKGQRVSRNNFDVDKKKLNSVEDEKKCPQSLGNEVDQRDFTAGSKENRGFGDRSVSHWQPKGFPSNNQHESRSNDSQNIKKESLVDKSSFQNDQSNFEKGILNGQNASQRRAKCEKKTSMHRGRPHSPNEGPVDLVEILPASATNARVGQRPSSGFHKGRLARGSDTFQDSSSGHDNHQHNPPAYRERPKHNFHYEYQPVVPHGSNKSYNSDDNAAPRYREKSRNNSRQVHIGVDTSYD